MANRGQFKPGNPGGRKGSGRKSKAEELGLEKLLQDCWSEKDRKACITKLAEDAKSDDFKIRHPSREMLFSYAYGRPKIQADVNHFDFTPEDLDLLNDYELECFLAGTDLRTLLTTARRRIAKEKAATAAAE